MNKPTLRSRCHSWLKLARISALPSALSNVALGYGVASVLVHDNGSFQVNPIGLAGLLLASSCLYLAGMILNDVFDIDQDRQQRPSRPLPAGEIPISVAKFAGYMLLVLGIGIATAAGWWEQATWMGAMPALLTASCLAAAILAYDKIWKTTWVAPWLMGGCRFLNVVLGASTLVFADQSNYLGTAAPILWLGFCLGIYVAGVTWFARQEANSSAAHDSKFRFELQLGNGLMLVAMIAMASSVWLGKQLNWLPDQKQSFGMMFLMLFGLIGLPVLRRNWHAMTAANPRMIQMAVGQALRSIILFDAALCFGFIPQAPGYAIAIAGLLIPSFLLSRWFKPT